MTARILMWLVAPAVLVTLPAARGQPDRPAVAAGSPFGIDQKADRLVLTHSGRPVAEFVFDDPKILRPYLANAHAPGGGRVTRNHPPVPGKDATDHDTMHPGVWLGFGDVNGIDFWRNKGSIRHRRFLAAPAATKNQVTFAAEGELRSPAGDVLGTLVNRLTLTARPAAWLLVWDATVRAERDLAFGDQEEMGFGARVATELAEKAGGTVRNSAGATTAKVTWGKAAAWCDYSGTAESHRRGVTLMASPQNFREPWWHNRDYGVFVANPFGRAALRQGPKSEVVVRRGESLRLVFGTAFHDGDGFDPAAEYRNFVEATR
jgi:hypothetical protein